ncbi:MAG TPA: hypothetical protein VE954_28765 [Oligoflexus sp.]|uniref:hypothetical protein n=1 Tax=Oligoflexus sp. TaxID=1971216 RepID=UPI002D46DB5F|nr:hypothetical protein [Oligoflexus sp.]HYX37113.1 hypothetical protein [Oligoflexus sp.]
MKISSYLILPSLVAVSIFAAACTTKDNGELKPLLTNPEIAVPTAIANKITGRDRIYLIKGEISQDQKCFRPYPMSRLKVKIRQIGDQAAQKDESTFYPNDRLFQKELVLDSKYSYLVQLIYEPTNVVLAEKKVIVEDPINVLLKIHCES